MRDFEAYAVFQINSLYFFAAITEVIRPKVGAGILAPVKYFTEKEWSDIVLPYATFDSRDTISIPRVSHVKDKSYAYQSEVRCTWEFRTHSLLKNNPNARFIKPVTHDSELNDFSIRSRKAAIGSHLVPEIIKAPKAMKYCDMIM